MRLERVEVARSSADGVEAAHSVLLSFWASVVYRVHCEISVMKRLHCSDAGWNLRVLVTV